MGIILSGGYLTSDIINDIIAPPTISGMPHAVYLVELTRSFPWAVLVGAFDGGSSGSL